MYGMAVLARPLAVHSSAVLVRLPGHINTGVRVMQEKHQAMRKQYQEVQSTMQRAFKWKGKRWKEISH